MRARAFALSTLLVTLASSHASAQVNTESLRPRGEEPGLATSAELNLGVAKGNVDYVDVGGGLRLQLQSLRPRRESEDPRFVHQRVFVVASARYAERAALGRPSEPFVSQSFAHARWTAMWRERFGSEVFGQVQMNEFLRLRVRTLGGTGFRFEIVRTEPVFVWAGTGAMLEYNRIDVAPGAADRATELSHRSTSYLGVRTQLREGDLLFQVIGYFQPAWKAPEDLRALVDLEALVRITSAFALGNTLSVLHDTRPPTAVRPTDLRLVTAVKVTF